MKERKPVNDYIYNPNNAEYDSDDSYSSDESSSDEEYEQVNNDYQDDDDYNSDEDDYQQDVEQYDSDEDKDFEVIPTTIKTINDVPIEGITLYEFKQLPVALKNKLQLCNDCERYYPMAVMMLDEATDRCQHCFFWMHYSPNLRTVGDNKYKAIGISIASYIDNFSALHDVKKCVYKNSCFLCDHNNAVQVKVEEKTDNSVNKVLTHLTI